VRRGPIAYQAFGDGPDLVWVPGWVSQLDLYWEEPALVRFLRRLAAFARVVVFDRRGLGLSDRVSVGRLPTLEQRMDDIRAVLDDLGVGRAAVLGQGYGSPIALLFAATYPQRTSSLVLYSPSAKAACGRTTIRGGRRSSSRRRGANDRRVCGARASSPPSGSPGSPRRRQATYERSNGPHAFCGQLEVRPRSVPIPR
jgi:pimeloyl-ACP methyl ester carboxylesterase